MTPSQQPGFAPNDRSQDTESVRRVVADLQPMLMSTETILYVAVQGRFAPTMHAVGAAMGVAKKQAVVATNQRLILYEPGMIGTARLIDIPWYEVDRVLIEQGRVGTTFGVQRVIGRAATERDGPVECVQYLEKDQAKRLFGICEELVQRYREQQRLRRLEEERAEAGGTNLIVNEPVPAPNIGAPTLGGATPVDPVAKLAQAKAMLDQGLISPEEFATIRARILTSF